MRWCSEEVGGFEWDLDEVRERWVERRRAKGVEVVVIQNSKESFWPSDEHMPMEVVELVEIAKGSVVTCCDSLSAID